MNLSRAVKLAIKELRSNGQSVTDDHKIFIHAIDGTLTVTALKRDRESSIAVRMPFNSPVTLCGCFSGRLRKLFRMLMNMSQEWTQGIDDRGDFLQIKGDSFTYRFDLTEHLLNIKKIVDLAIDITVHDVNIDTEHTQATQKKSIMNTSVIIIKNDYFDDLQSAVKVGLFTGKGTNPRKVALYETIDAYNTKVSAEVKTIAIESVKSSNEAYDELLTQFKEEKKIKNSIVSKPAVKRVKIGVSGKSLDKSEVWEADRIRFVKRSSQMGRVLEYMFNNDGISFVETDGLDLTKTQFVQAIGSISEAGYGIVKRDNRFTVVLPKELEAPKLK
jgi:hypothetical protein